MLKCQELPSFVSIQVPTQLIILPHGRINQTKIERKPISSSKIERHKLNKLTPNKSQQGVLNYSNFKPIFVTCHVLNPILLGNSS